MDAFIKALKDLSNELLPIFGAIVLVCLIVLEIKLIKLLKSADITLNKSHKTIDLLDTTMQKVQSPLDTAVKLSSTVDKAYDKTADVLKKGKAYVTKNANNIKEKVTKNTKKQKAD